MTDERGGFGEGSLEELASCMLTLVVGNLRPVLGGQGFGLSGCQLFQVRTVVRDGELDEKQEGLRVLVEFILQNTCSSPDIALLRVEDNSQLLQESLLVHSADKLRRSGGTLERDWRGNIQPK